MRLRVLALLALLPLLAPPRPCAAQEAVDPYAGARATMVEEQIAQRGVRDPGVLSAMRQVPRHLFVPQALRDQAYVDDPLPIGDGQTISQPYIVALMTQLLELEGDEKVLEIGTGSGYQAAVLARLARQVYTIEIRAALGRNAERTLEELGFDNVHVRIGNGYLGWPEAAPFDAIIVTAAPDHIPGALIEQLAVGGRMVVPVGTAIQDLVLLTKTADGVAQRKVVPVRFVPMIGEVEQER